MMTIFQLQNRSLDSAQQLNTWLNILCPKAFPNLRFAINKDLTQSL